MLVQACPQSNTSPSKYLIAPLFENLVSPWIMTRCRLNRNKRCQNSLDCFGNEKVIFVFFGLEYDSMKPNHTKKVKKTLKNAKIAKLHCSALQCTAMHNREPPQILTQDGSNMTHNDPGWLSMAQDDIPGVRGAPGGAGGTRGRQGALGYLWRKKRVIKQ